MNPDPGLLQPPNAVAWEQVTERVSAERWPLDADIIRRAKDPWSCPEELLPYLAYELSVDLWDESWPVAKKRSVIAGALKLARIKGTEAAIREAVAIMGGEVISVTTPPGTIYLLDAQSPEERQAWLARMPQLRIYPQRLPSSHEGMYVGEYSDGFLLESTAFLDATPRSTLWRNGVETELVTLERRLEDPTISDADEFVEVREPGPVPSLFAGGPSDGFLCDSSAAEAVHVVRTRSSLTIPGREHLAADYAAPGLEPVDVRAETVREPSAMVGLWSGGCLPDGVSGYLLESDARLHVFKRVYLHDPETLAPTQDGGVYLGYNSRFGPPAFEAELAIDIPIAIPPTGLQPEVYGFLVEPDDSAWRSVVEAVLTHKGLRDRILIDTQTRVEITAGPDVTAGAGFTAGQIVPVQERRA